MTARPIQIEINLPTGALLEVAAPREGMTPDSLASHLVNESLHRNDDLLNDVRSAVVEANQGHFVSRASVMSWVSSWDTASEQPPPVTDIRLDVVS